MISQTAPLPSMAVIGPNVGIFWLLPSWKLVVDTTPVSQAEAYGRFRIHGPSHIEVWDRWRQQRTVPPETEYDDLPRGRTAFDIVAENFTILADQCILRDTGLVAEIKRLLHLPDDTSSGLDLHYRCPRCLYGDDQDWGGRLHRASQQSLVPSCLARRGA